MKSFWNGPDAEEKIAILKELIDEGLSFSQIAHRMGAPSRNVVLCKANRLKIPNKNSALQRTYVRERVPKLPKPKPAPVEEVLPQTPFLINGAPVTLENITDKMCRYPVGDPQKIDFQYCGHERHGKSRYCEAHHTICNRPPPARPSQVRPYRPYRNEKQFA